MGQVYMESILMGQIWSQWPVSLLPLTCRSLSVTQNKIQTVPIVKKRRRYFDTSPLVRFSNLLLWKTFVLLEEPDSSSSPCFAKEATVCDIHQHAGSSCEELSTCKGREDTVAAWHAMHCTPGPNWNCTHGLKVQ